MCFLWAGAGLLFPKGFGQKKLYEWNFPPGKFGESFKASIIVANITYTKSFIRFLQSKIKKTEFDTTDKILHEFSIASDCSQQGLGTRTHYLTINQILIGTFQVPLKIVGESFRISISPSSCTAASRQHIKQSVDRVKNSENENLCLFWQILSYPEKFGILSTRFGDLNEFSTMRQNFSALFRCQSKLSTVHFCENFWHELLDCSKHYPIP